jgi:hypothetical protein
MMMWMSDDGVWPSCRQGVFVVLYGCAQERDQIVVVQSDSDE